jgi:hypothetical protein
MKRATLLLVVSCGVLLSPESGEGEKHGRGGCGVTPDLAATLEKRTDLPCVGHAGTILVASSLKFVRSCSRGVELRRMRSSSRDFQRREETVVAPRERPATGGADWVFAFLTGD